MTTEIDDSSKSKSPKGETHRNFGFLMQEAREKAGYSIERAAMSTRIAPAFIEALEQERFEVLPGAIFGRGFIRNLCRSYGADAEALTRAFDQALMQKSHPEPAQTTREKTSAKKVRVKDAPGYGSQAEWKARVRESIGTYYGKGKPFIFITPFVVLGIYLAQAAYNRNEEPVTAAPPSSAAVITEPTPAPGSTLVPATGTGPATDTAALAPAGTTAPATAAAPQEPFNGIVRGEGIEAIEIYVKDAVNIGMTRDRERQTSEVMRPGAYKLQFNEQMKLYVEDMSAVEIKFKGQTIPNKGIKGEERFMTFAVSDSAIAKSTEKTKL